MRRKIPGRKHHGVRDPEKQKAQREALFKDKINAPPKDPDHQQVSKSLDRFILLKNKTKAGEFDKKKKKVGEKVNLKESPVKKPKDKSGDVKPFPIFKQNPGETPKNFLYRINKICENVTKEAHFEDKFGVTIKRNEMGEVTHVQKRPKDELQLLINKARKEKKSNFKKKVKNAEKEQKLTKAQKWQLKKKEKKNKSKLKLAQKENKVTENIPFGDVAKAPPTLVAPRRVEKKNVAARPGTKELLLKSLIDNAERPIKVTKISKMSEVRKPSKKLEAKAIDTKGKRKNLPNALRRQLDKQQAEVIEAYKKLKAKSVVV